jgi:metabotropic glutamate receptor 2/3
MKFDRNGDGLGRYNIYNYQQLPNSSIYQYILVGRWADLGLQLEKEKLKFNEGSQLMPTSICSHPCQVGEIKIVQQGDHCCWICSKCELWEYVYNESHCADCGEGRWPNKDKVSCYDLNLQYMEWDSLFAIVPIVIACLGIALTLFVIITFIKYSDTPIVKASGRELSFILLGGIMFCYLNTFILLTKPTTITCAIQRFGVCVHSLILFKRSYVCDRHKC